MNGTNCVKFYNIELCEEMRWTLLSVIGRLSNISEDNWSEYISKRPPRKIRKISVKPLASWIMIKQLVVTCDLEFTILF